jgi:formate dehydrogenase subunit gamma
MEDGAFLRATRSGLTVDETALDRILARHQAREGPLLPILHDVQDVFGCISEKNVIAIAAALNLSRAEVSGVVSFYHDFSRTARDRPIIKLCRAEACQARGVEALARTVRNTERVEIETVYCLGLCSVGPAAMVGEEVHARLDEASLSALIDRVAAA